MSTTVILAFFLGMLFRDIFLFIIVRMARRAKERGVANVQAPSKADMEALAKAIIEDTMLVEMDEMDGMLYCYRKADGQFLAQAPSMEGMRDMLRQRHGVGKHYILEDNDVINT